MEPSNAGSLCERCGLILGSTESGRIRHERVCRKLPRSEDLAFELIDRRISKSKLGRDYDKFASHQFINERVELGLNRLRKSNPRLVREWEQWRESYQIKSSSIEKAKKSKKKREKLQKCIRCKVILEEGTEVKYCPECFVDVRKIALLGPLSEFEAAKFVIL